MELSRPLPDNQGSDIRTNHNRRDSIVVDDVQPVQTWTIATSNSCAVEFREQVSALQRLVAAVNGPDFTCPSCARCFPAKKTLARHANTTIRLFEESPFICSLPQCGKRFARKDILTRSVRAQHFQGHALIECEICRQQVRPRSYRGHKKTKACADGGNRIAVPPRERVTHERKQPDSSWEAFISLQTHLRDILDCVLLTAWMFTKLKPWGPDEASTSLWFAKDQRPPMERPKYQFPRALRLALEAPDIPWNSHLLDAIAIIKCVIAVTEGWEQADLHSNAYKKLAHIQITSMGLTKDAFMHSPLSQAWDSVPKTLIPATDRAKCRSLIQMFLRLMRSSTWDSVSRLTNNFSKPLDNAAIMGHTKSNTRTAFFNGYRDQIIAIYHAASNIGKPLL